MDLFSRDSNGILPCQSWQDCKVDALPRKAHELFPALINEQIAGIEIFHDLPLTCKCIKRRADTDVPDLQSLLKIVKWSLKECTHRV